MERERAIENDSDILREFAGLYCKARHDTQVELCPACSELLEYSIQRRRKCPLDPKPPCKDCRIHCYDAQHRAAIREVMRFGAMHYVKRGRVGKLIKMLFKIHGGRRKATERLS